MARSRTDPEDPGRCPRCLVRLPHCICAHVPRIESSVEVVIVRHFLEAVRSTNTGRIAALALPHARVISFGAPGDRAGDLRFEDAALLFPGGGAERGGPVRRLVVIDGSWHQARRMAQRIPSIRGLPRLSLPPRPGAHRLRAAPRPEAMSTIEAIALALGRLQGPAAERALLDLHARHVTAVLRARGAPA